MKKISLIFFTSILLCFFTAGFAYAEKIGDSSICDREFTDSTGKTDSANDWCEVDGIASFKFCDGDVHYSFECETVRPVPGTPWLVSNCKTDTAYYETCTDGCEPWDCSEESGCGGGSCNFLKEACPDSYNCCYNESMYLDKACSDGLICVDHSCQEEGEDDPDGGTGGGYTSDKAKLELDWPTSPGGTPLNNSSTLTDLIKYLYEWGIALGGLAVFVALLMAGIQYLTSFGNPVSMKDAMSRIQSAVIGLILLLSSWLILNTINPELTTFQEKTFDFQAPDVPPLNSSSLLEMDDTKICEEIIVKTSGGDIELNGGGRNTDVWSIGAIKSSEGWSGGKLDGTCMGQLKFYRANCSDEIASLPPTNETITVDEDQVIKCIRFIE